MQTGVVLTCFWLAGQATADLEGSADHPLVTRFPGSFITWYEVQNFERYRLPLGPVVSFRKIDRWQDVEGRITRIHYLLKGERGFTEVYVNYQDALKQAGFEVLVSGMNKKSSVQGKVGERGFLDVLERANPTPPGKNLLNKGTPTQGGSGYLGAKLKDKDRTVYVSLAVEQHSQNEVAALVDIIEVQAVESGLITVDADAMGKALDQTGKVALYGIYFDHDKATLKPESKPALDEIAKLMQARPLLSLYVVGHTDDTGELAYNMKLSRDRAEAVVKALAGEYKIKVTRLLAHGVGPLAPVANNQAEPGRAQNRRVELVQRVK